MSSASIANERPGVALISGGFIGPVHVEALRRIGIQVVGLLEISPKRARQQAERLAIGRASVDLDDSLVLSRRYLPQYMIG
jgi:predicted dehydrogenase